MRQSADPIWSISRTDEALTLEIATKSRRFIPGHRSPSDHRRRFPSPDCTATATCDCSSVLASEVWSQQLDTARLAGLQPFTQNILNG
jgi:hypothetical protein